MDRLHSMGVFVAVAEEESFAAAARRLNMSPPAVTRTIAALEAHLGVKVLTRTTRFVRATDAGQRYLESARRILAEADEADEAAAGVHASPRGQLAVTAPVLFGSMHVMPVIVGFLARYPEVSVTAVLLDRAVNLLEEGIDVGVRIGELPDSTLHAIPVGSVRRVICASPGYLAGHPELSQPGDLARQTIISASPVSPGIEWHMGRGKQQIIVKVQPRLSVNNNAAAIEAAFGEEAPGVSAAVNAFLAALPLALRVRMRAEDSSPPRDLFCAHSLPSAFHASRFDAGVFDRALRPEDYLPRTGAAHQLVWGRGHTPEDLAALGDAWGVGTFLLGHEKAENGYNVLCDRGVIINSDHEAGAYLRIDLSREWSGRWAPRDSVALCS